MDRSSRSTPTGPGSRGGAWHLPEFRKLYHRRWRRANPEYRERERLRMARARATARGEDPALVFPADIGPRLPALAASCACPCGCELEIVAECGFCHRGLHEVTA